MRSGSSWGRSGMSSSNETRYCLIFDTNALFQAYEKKADFTSFSFNATFDNVIDMINQLPEGDCPIVISAISLRLPSFHSLDAFSIKI